jgi:hypothetical protein
MSDILHLRIKKQYAAALIEDLIKVDAIESVEEDTIELTPSQKAALDKELQAIKDNPNYLLKWEEIKHGYKKP